MPIPMTAEAKRALSKTIRALRERLLSDLHDATEGEYRLALKPEQAALDEAQRTRRGRLERWIEEQSRGLARAEQNDARERFRREVEKDAASCVCSRPRVCATRRW